MSTDDDRRLRSWLGARDPGDAPASLRAAAIRVPYETRQPIFAGLDTAITQAFGTARWIRPVLVLMLVLALVAAAVGAALVQPWRPFPPRGLIAFTGPLGPIGTSGIRLVAADGSGERVVTPLQPNLFDHSPRWSADGRALLFARTSSLDPLSACGGVGSVVLYDLATATERVVATGLRPIDVVSWSPSGARIAYLYPPPGCNAETELGVVDVATGKVTTTDLGISGTSGTWQLQWRGESAGAIPGVRVAQAGGGDITTSLEVPSHDGQARAMFEFRSATGSATLGVATATGPIDLGSGGSPAWAPDDSAIAFIQPPAPGGPQSGDLLRHPLAIAPAASWRARVVADVYWPSNAAPNDLPPVFWTADGGAIYWGDARGAHVVDLVTGRMADLPAALAGCPNLEWQPAP